MLNLNTLSEILILCFHKEKYHKDSDYMEVTHEIDDIFFLDCG